MYVEDGSGRRTRLADGGAFEDVGGGERAVGDIVFGDDVKSLEGVLFHSDVA